MTDQERWMKQALRLARKGAGWVNPNPMVGAVLVKDGNVIGQGFHRYFGGPHAEVEALNSVTVPVNDATLYVNLEPCIHQGKTPPCTRLLVEKGIRRVVVAMPDPNPLMNGKGISWLKSHGVQVETGLLQSEAERLNEIFCKYIRSRKPFCLYKGAMTLDGKIATVTGESRWISSEVSRNMVHNLRHEFSAVMVGLGTVLKDDPGLQARRSGRVKKDPLKVIVDSSCRIPQDSRVLAQNPQLTVLAVTRKAPLAKMAVIRRMGAQVIVCPEKHEQVDLHYLMLALGAMDIDSVLMEGGGTLAFSALQDNIIDKVLFFIAPKFLGGKKAPTLLEGDGFRRMAEAVPLKSMEIKKLGEDLIIEGYL